MIKEFTKEFLIWKMERYSTDQVLKLSFIDNEKITIADIINSELPLADALWFIFNQCEVTKSQRSDIAWALAKIVYPIYVKFEPNDKSVGKCLLGITDFLIDDIESYDLEKIIVDVNPAYCPNYYADSAKNSIIWITKVFTRLKDYYDYWGYNEENDYIYSSAISAVDAATINLDPNCKSEHPSRIYERRIKDYIIKFFL